MSDTPKSDGAYSPNEPKPTAPKRSYDADDAELDSLLPSLAKRDGGSSLGGLAQSARLKQITTARNLLYVVGVIQVAFSSWQLYMFKNAEEQGIPLDIPYHVAYAITGLFLAAGVAFLLLGAFVKTFPLPCTIASLVLFIAVHGASAMLDPVNIASGFILKIIFLVSLIRAIMAARAYENAAVPSEESTS